MDNMKDIIDLAVATVTKENIPSEFTAADLENSLREQLSAFQDYKYLRKHAADLYEIIEEVANIVIPRKVLEQFGGFAEIRRKGYGEKISFTIRTGKYRGKKFVTKAGDQGIYKTFTLDNKELVMQPRVYAGATRLEIEDFLLGRISMSELLDVLTEALEEKLYIEIAGVIQNDKNNSWRTTDYKYKRHTDYQQKMLFKEKLLIENNCNYLFLFPCEMKTGKYKEILQNKINEIIEEVA